LPSILQQERLALMRLAAVPGVRPDRLLALLSHFGSAQELLSQKADSLAATSLVSLETAARLLATAAAFDAEKVWESCQRNGIVLLFLSDETLEGPLELLKSIPDPPILLYCLGRPPENFGALAIVGTRRPTPYGRRMARRLAREAVEAGVPVVSGLARGIDTEAHCAALEAGGRTWAVLGSGLSRPYPPENTPLIQRISEAGGAVLTEFPPEAPPLAEHFPRRNRLISGLSLATVVVEGTQTSGALTTARLALEQGREVFAVPGPADSEASRAPHLLLRQGAGLMTCVEDAQEVIPQLRRSRPPLPDAPTAAQDPDAMLALLREAPRTVEELVAALKEPVSAVSRRLLDMEIAGLVEALPGQRYALK